jgi:hypothetical protein
MRLSIRWHFFGHPLNHRVGSIDSMISLKRVSKIGFEGTRLSAAPSRINKNAGL